MISSRKFYSNFVFVMYSSNSKLKQDEDAALLLLRFSHELWNIYHHYQKELCLKSTLLYVC